MDTWFTTQNIVFTKMSQQHNHFGTIDHDEYDDTFKARWRKGEIQEENGWIYVTNKKPRKIKRELTIEEMDRLEAEKERLEEEAKAKENGTEINAELGDRRKNKDDLY